MIYMQLFSIFCLNIFKTAGDRLQAAGNKTEIRTPKSLIRNP